MTIKERIKEMQELEYKLAVSDIEEKYKILIRERLVILYNLIYNI